MDSILVLGSDGDIGKKVVDALIKKGINILETTRNIKKVRKNKFFIDITEYENLKQLIQQADLVINCVGPSYKYKDRVIKIANELNKHYIDVFGGDLLEKDLLNVKECVSVVNAGCEPGITGILPKFFKREFSSDVKLKIFSGGRSMGGNAALADIILSSIAGYSKNDFCIKNNCILKSKENLKNITLKIDDNLIKVSARPYLTKENERFASRYEVNNLCSYRIITDKEIDNIIKSSCIELIKSERIEDFNKIVLSAWEELSKIPQNNWYCIKVEKLIKEEKKECVTLVSKDSSMLTSLLIVLVVDKILKGKIKNGGYWAFEVVGFEEFVDFLSSSEYDIKIIYDNREEKI